MWFSRPFHLLVAILFLFQAVLPANLPAAAPAVTDQAAAEERSDNPLSSLFSETAILADISVEMKALLGDLHDRYPEQITLWQALLATLQDSDPRKPDLAEQAGTAEALLSLLVGYSTHFDTLQRQLLTQLEESGETPEWEVNQLVARLYTLLQYQEKISSYELLAQGQLRDIHLLARTINATDEQIKINEKIEAFETYRRQHIRQFLTVREEFEQVKTGFAFLNQAEDESNLAPIRQEAVAYRELADRLAAGQQEDTSAAGRDFLAQLEQIAADRQRDMEAILAALSDGREGRSWPLLFQPGAVQKSSAQSDWSFTPERLLSVLSDMRTAFIELTEILEQRNTLLLDGAFLQRDDMLWLSAHIELENLHLDRLAKIITATGEPAPQGDREAYQQSMIQWEEFGLLKEDILAVEALILNELTVSLDDETFADDESWQQVTALLQRQDSWRIGWADIAASFAQVVEGYKTFQAQLLQEKLQAIETLRADIERSQKRLSSQPDSPLDSFLILIDEALAEHQEETRLNNDLKTESQRQEQDDPLFSPFFGVNSERFLNDFKYMGIALWDHAALTDNLTRIRAHLLALSSAGIKEHRQPLLILQLADQLGVIDRIEYDTASCTVHLRSTSHAMEIRGCGRNAPPELRSAASDQTVPRPLTARHLIRSLFCFASPAHAGLYEQFTGWSSTSFNQMKKNWVNYAVTGVVLVGALAAAPVVAAAGATAATVATVAAGATTVALGAKAAFYAQATADISLGTSRHTINQMDFSRSKYSWANKKYFNTKLDQMETAYNIAKVAEGLWRFKYPKVADGVKNAEHAAKARQLGLSKQLQSNRAVIARCGQQVKKGTSYSKNLFKQLQHADSQRQLARAKTLQKVLEHETALSGANAKELAALTSNLTRLGQRIVEGTGVGPNAKSSVEGIINWPGKDPDGNATPGANTNPGDPSDQRSAGQKSDKPPDPPPGADSTSDDPSEQGADGDESDEPADPTPGADTTPDDPSGPGVDGDESDEPADPTPGANTTSDDTSEQGVDGDESGEPADPTPGADTTPDDPSGPGTDDHESDEPADPIDALKNTDTQGPDPSTQTTDIPTIPFSGTSVDNLPGGWSPAATQITEEERDSAARSGNALSQLNADRQRMETDYQSGQTENQQRNAASMAQIDRQRSTQMVDAIVGGVTSGVAQGVGTLGQRIGQGAGTRIAQDTGLVDRHPKSPVPEPSGGRKCRSTSDCPAGNTCDSATQTCAQQDNTAKSYRGSWRASSTCAANFGGKGTGTCSWNGSAQITLHPGGRVSGTITGGSRFNWNEGGNFTGCGGGSSSNSISGSHANGSFSGSISNGARLSGTYTDAAITGTTKGSATNAVTGGKSMSCTTSGSISLSR